MSKDPLWFRKWKTFFRRLEDIERKELVAYLKTQLRGNCKTTADFLKLLNLINSAEKGKLIKDHK